MAVREWRLLKVEDDLATTFKDKENVTHKIKPLTFWKKGFLLKTLCGDVKYPLFSLIIKYVIILPFGTASVERDFSLVNI